jgi:hypothetical protein
MILGYRLDLQCCGVTVIELGIADPKCACGHPKSWHDKNGCIGDNCIQGFPCPFFVYPDQILDAISRAVWQGL